MPKVRPKIDYKRVYVHEPPRPSPSKRNSKSEKEESRNMGACSFINRSSMILDGETDITINAYGGRNSLLKQATPTESEQRPFLTAKEELHIHERSTSHAMKKFKKSSLTLSSSISSTTVPSKSRKCPEDTGAENVGEKRKSSETKGYFTKIPNCFIPQKEGPSSKRSLRKCVDVNLSEDSSHFSTGNHTLLRLLENKNNGKGFSASN